MGLGATLKTATIAGLLGSAVALSACSTGETLSHGYQVSDEALALVPEGSSRDQVLLSLGSPSTTLQEQGGNETFYYISTKKHRSVQFRRAKVVDQRVLAVYFDDNDNVARIADYGLQDGRVFDFVRRVTPTGGADITFVGQILGAAGSALNPFGG
jgi:outer membrane protein assembly factor BamE (lipoprotein component of BamABCDE complex)